MQKRDEQVYLAVDLGATSGRVIAGCWDDGRLTLDILNRFANGPVQQQDGAYRWPLAALKDGIREGLRRAANRYGTALRSVGVDTWGVDYGLVDRAGALRAPPYAYRDPRVEGMMDAAFRRMPQPEIYRRTGIQFMPINTLYQLLAEPRDGAADAGRLLFMPDLIHEWLTGVQTNEYTVASTSQMLDVHTRTWSKEIIQAMNFPRSWFQPLIQPGDRIGVLHEERIRETGCPPIPVVAPPGHDTAAAVVAVPFASSNAVFISAGTWSLLGMETPTPVVSDAAYAYGLTNEGGVFGTTRLLKNICGFWILEGCRQQWQDAGQPAHIEDLCRAAAVAPPFRSLINPDDPRFATPGDMLGRIAAFCEETGQPVPDTPGATTRCLLESLALRYRSVLPMLEEVSGRRVDTIHIVGGGSQNELLNQFAANATGCMVHAGPVEATAIGNLLIQGIADGALPNLDEARRVVRRSFDVRTYHPDSMDEWAAAADRVAVGAAR